MTKERLHKYREDEAATILARARVKEVVKGICNQIERLALRTYERKFVFEMKREQPVSYDSTNDCGNRLVIDPKTGQYKSLCEIPRLPILETILEDLRTLFPDSKITMDPLETYILIDWS